MPMIDDKETDELDKMLGQMKPDQLDTYYRDNRPYMADDKKAFYYYMKNVLDQKRIKLKDVYSFAGYSESYGSKILTMEKHTKNRDVILRLCLAGRLNLDELGRALKLYGFNELYAKNKRDACIIVAVNNRIYDLYDIDDMLRKQKLEPLINPSDDE